MNFRGPPGTGKTLAAHAIAHRLGLRIMSARLSDLESKYHGDGPKNLANLFAAATRERALLFIDEAELATIPQIRTARASGRKRHQLHAH